MPLPTFNTRVLSPTQVNTLPNAAPQPTENCLPVALASDHAPIPVSIETGVINLTSADSTFFSLSPQVGLTSARILPYDGTRVGLTIINSSPAANITVNVVGGPAAPGAANCITFGPGFGYPWPPGFSPLCPITAVSDVDGARLAVHVWNRSGYDPLLDDFLDLLPDAVDDTHRALIGALRGALMSSGVFDALDAFSAPMLMQTQANALINWVSPSTPMTLQGATPPTYTPDRGWSGTGAGYIDTGIEIPQKLTAAAASMFALVSDTLPHGANEYVIGAGGAAVQANRTATTNAVRACFASGEIITINADRWVAWTRRSPTKAVAYSGAQRVALATPSSTLSSREMFALALNSLSGPVNYSTSQLNLFGFGRDLSHGQMVAARAAALAAAQGVGAV